MIYVHCGWPRTGTTSLQAVLAAHRRRIADAGLCIPDTWRKPNEAAHYGLTDVLESIATSRGAVGEFKRSLAGCAEGDVLLSNEALTNWLHGEDRLEALLTLLRAANDIAPVTCVWALRRFDEMAHSAYVQIALRGTGVKPPVEFMDSLPKPDLFRAMRRVEKAVDGRASYVKYGPGRRYGRELLTALGLPAALAHALADELATSPRRAASRDRTQKQVIAAGNFDELCAKLGLAVEGPELLRRLWDSGFEFEEDGPCELAGPEVRRSLHRRALRVAGESGFDPYLRFFADDDPQRGPPAGSLRLDALSGEDLQRLAAHLDRPGLTASGRAG